MYKLDLEKAAEPEIIEKAREFQKNIYFCFTDYAKAFDCLDLISFVFVFESIYLILTAFFPQQTVENSSRDGNTRPPYLPPEKIVCRSRSNS